MIAVGCARAGVNEARDAGVARRDQHLEKTRDVVVVSADRAFDRARHAAAGRLMQDDVRAPAGAAALIERADIALDEVETFPAARLYARLYLGQVVPVAGREIVQAGHVLIQLQEGLHEMRADEPGGTGDQPPARATPDKILRFLVHAHRSRIVGFKCVVLPPVAWSGWAVAAPMIPK